MVPLIPSGTVWIRKARRLLLGQEALKDVIAVLLIMRPLHVETFACQCESGKIVVLTLFDNEL